MRRSAIGFLFAIVALPAIAGPPALGTTTTTSATAPPLSQRSMIVTSQDFSNLLADDCEHFHTRNVTPFPPPRPAGPSPRPPAPRPPPGAPPRGQREVPRRGIDSLKIPKGERGGVPI